MLAVAARQWPLLSAPRPGDGRLCVVCHGPSGRGNARCYQCELHSQCAPDALADVVVPVAFAVKGSAHARMLWQYKSPHPRADVRADAALTLRALLLVFLRDHGECLWQAAGITGPTHVAVVPTARGRPGLHPLRVLVGENLARPWAELHARRGEQIRDLDPVRFIAAALPGAQVLLLDDTWTTGSSAQSAAMALRRAGANSVVTVVLGRHVSEAAAEVAGISRARMPFRQDRCAADQIHVAGR